MEGPHVLYEGLSDGRREIERLADHGRASMQVAIVIIFNGTGRHFRRRKSVTRITDWAGHSRSAAAARVLTFPRPVGMRFANPQASIAARAGHANRSAPACVNFT
jgi:hypothetical protein